MNKFLFILFILIIIFTFSTVLSPVKEFFNIDEKEMWNRNLKTCMIYKNMPLQCSYTYGNYIFPLDYKKCWDICPNLVKKEKERREGKNSSKMITQGVKKENFITSKYNPSYYCYEADWNNANRKCVKKQYNINDPSKNSCGNDLIANSANPLYTSKSECEKDNFKCRDLPKDKCLKIWGCGWNTNSWGEGECIDGYSYGSKNITYQSWVSNGSENNNFNPGHEDYFDILNPQTNL